MKRNASLLKLFTVKTFLMFSVPAFSQSFYVSGSAGQNYQDDTSNNGAFTSAFTTGAVTGVNSSTKHSGGKCRFLDDRL